MARYQTPFKYRKLKRLKIHTVKIDKRINGQWTSQPTDMSRLEAEITYYKL